MTSTIDKIASFMVKPQLEAGIQDGWHVIIARLKKPMELASGSKKKKYVDGVIVESFENEEDATRKCRAYNDMLHFFSAVSDVEDAVCSSEPEINRDYRHDRLIDGKTVAVDVLSGNASCKNDDEGEED